MGIQKPTGIIRPLDRIGRLVLPIYLRRQLNIYGRAPIEISVDGDSIVLKKYKERCTFCRKELSDDEVESKIDHIDIHGKHICKSCLADIKLL